MGLYQYDSTQDKLNLVAGSTNFSDAPIGAIYPFGGTDIPVSFLLCDGSAVSRTDYEDLFNVIGTAFGTGDGSTTFNLPDLREAVPKGAGLTGKTVGAHLDADGLAVGEFLDDQIQAHTHSNKTGASTAGAAAWTMFATERVETATEQTNNGVIGRFGVTTEVKSVGVNYIIKAKMTAIPADFLSAVDETINENATSPVSASNKLVTANSLEAEYTDLASYLSTGWSVREYVRGYKIGKMVIIDFGGLTSDSSAAKNQYIMQNLPYSIKNRAVTTLFSDEPENFKKMTVYVVDNQGTIEPDLRANYPSLSGDDNFYGQMIIALN